MMNKYIKKGRQAAITHKTILENMSWVSAVEIFMLIAPLITYPYLTKVLGIELYGVFVSAQVLASYATLIIDFGSNSVVAKHVSINRDNKEKLSEIVCSVFIVRGFLFLVCLPIYIGVVAIIPAYRSYWLLFLITYGLTFNDVLYPRYFFQGIEKMRISSIINIGIKLSFILLVFILVRNKDDLMMVPVLYTVGYALAGLVSMWIIFGTMKIPFAIPSVKQMLVYVKDSSSIFATDLIRTIKDKFNYILLGTYSGMSNVVIYDLGIKLNLLIGKPGDVINQVLFPRFAKTRDTRKLNIAILVAFMVSLVAALAMNLFLPWVVTFFIHTEIDLLPLRIFSIAPVLLSVSSFISQSFFIAFGYNKYILYSIIVTTIGYLFALGFVIITHQLASIYSFVSISLFAYFVEFIYRIIVKEHLIKKASL